VRSWDAPAVPTLPGTGRHPRLYDTPSREVRHVVASEVAQLYVCGITPYDATHLGHAATYLAYDTLGRVLRDAGLRVEYVQNTTDVDDPLLERATATGQDWRELAASQVDLFRGDMEALRIIPPDHYVGVVESIDAIAAACRRLLDEGFAYWVDSADAGPDLYFDIAAAESLTDWRLGQESGLDRAAMLELSAERGGDPDRNGKRDPLDPLLWRSEREGEPAWDSPLGCGRPGWHIECSVIGAEHLTAPISVNGGGSDLVFPHHELSAAHSAALTGTAWSHAYSHAGMVSLDGAKMSKSLGNLVLVSRLVASGADPRSIRLALLAHHYRSDWQWEDEDLQDAAQRLDRWMAWAKTVDADSSSTLLAALRSRVADDLDTPGALDAVEAAIASGAAPNPADLDAIDALLGIDLAPGQ
jgi:L-cysteine:1D-myo-inositol 2-amino-2-deoxy-alpha-D-glucopyranoside ligase